VWRAGVIDCHCVRCSPVIDTQPCLRLTYSSLTRLQFASERLASNCQSAAAAIVVCNAARVVNKMSMMTTVRVGPDSVE